MKSSLCLSPFLFLISLEPFFLFYFVHFIGRPGRQLSSSHRTVQRLLLQNPKGIRNPCKPDPVETNSGRKKVKKEALGSFDSRGVSFWHKPRLESWAGQGPSNVVSNLLSYGPSLARSSSKLQSFPEPILDSHKRKGNRNRVEIGSGCNSPVSRSS